MQNERDFGGEGDSETPPQMTDMKQEQNQQEKQAEQGQRQESTDESHQSIADQNIKQELDQQQHATPVAEQEGQDSGTDQQQQQMNNLDQTDIYRELILRHLIADISGTCTKLGLSSDLGAWSCDDCRRWVAEMCAQFQLCVPGPGGSAFVGLDGRRLLALSVEEFQERFPDGGDTLHAQLQLWKTAFESCGQPVPASCAQPQQQRHLAEGPCWLSSSPPNESCCSSSASSSSSSSSFHHHHPHHQLQYAEYSNHSHASTIFTSSVQGVHHSLADQSPQHHHHLVGQSGALRSDCSDCSMSSSSALPDDSSSVADDELLGNSSATFPATSSHVHHHFFMAPSLVHHQMANPYQQQQPQLVQFQPQPQFRPVHGPQQGRVAQQHAQLLQPNHNRVATSHGSGGTIHLWHFIRELLEQPVEYGGCVRWVDRKEGTFKIESSHHLARFWGLRKNRAAMNYDKLSRSLRQYYKKGIIQKPEKKQRLVYKFLPPYNQ